jgi:hypothetical protein
MIVALSYRRILGGETPMVDEVIGYTNGEAPTIKVAI